MQTFDPDGSPAGLASRVWGPGDVKPMAPPPQDPPPAGEPVAEAPSPERDGPQDPAQDPQDVDERRRRDAEIRTRLGSAVIIAADGTVTKQYSLSGEAVEVFLNLLREPAAPEPPDVAAGVELDRSSRSVLARMMGEHHIKVTVFKDFEPLATADIKTEVKGVLPAVSSAVKNSLVLVSGDAESVLAFEEALDLFFSSAPQIEIEVKVVEFSSTDGVAFGVRPLDANTPTLGNLRSERLIRDITSSFPLSPPTIGLEDKGLITLGGVHDGWELNAILEALEVNQQADILSQPTLTVRNGGLASVSTITKVPFPKAKFTSSGSNVVADIVFENVGITLNIRPVIAGTNSVILQIYAQVSAVVGFTTSQPVPIPTIAQREVVTQVLVSNGQATTIGGLLTTSQFDSVNKVPLLGDIPILGYLFRSTTKQEVRTNVEFIITPRIQTSAERGDEVDLLMPIGG